MTAAQPGGVAVAARPARELSVPEPVIAEPSTALAQPSSRRSAPLLVIAIALVAIALAGTLFVLLQKQPSAPAPIIDGRASAAATETYGLDKYPGAHPVQPHVSTSDIVIASFETADSPAQVIGYYRVRFPVNQLASTEDGQMLMAAMNGGQVTIHADALVHGSRVLITLSR